MTNVLQVEQEQVAAGTDELRRRIYEKALGFMQNPDYRPMIVSASIGAAAVMIAAEELSGRLDESFQEEVSFGHGSGWQRGW